MGTPQKHYTKRLRAIGHAEPGHMHDLCERLVRRIWRLQRNDQCSVYLLADSEGYVYLASVQSYGAAWAERLPRMVVGLYSAVPDQAQLVEDLTQHLLDLMAVA
jgi:hypothetical protein